MRERQERNRSLEDDVKHWKSVSCSLEGDLAQWKSRAVEWKSKYENDIGDSQDSGDYEKEELDSSQHSNASFLQIMYGYRSGSSAN